MEGQPVSLDPLPGHATAGNKPLLDIRLHLERSSPVLRGAGKPIEYRLTPRDMRLTHRRELAKQAYGGGIDHGVGGIGVVDVAADQMRLQHPVDRDQSVNRRAEIPDVLAESSEVVGGRLLARPRRAQLLQA